MQHSFLPQNVQDLYSYLIQRGISLRVEDKQGEKQLIVKGLHKNPEASPLIKKFKVGLIAVVEGRKLNDFQQSLEKGSNSLHYPFADAVYQHVFYNFDFCKRSQSGDTPAQKTGADVIVYLTSDRVVRIDEKFRYREDFSDIALEYISSTNRGTPGWMEKDLGIDYLNYAFVTIKRAYLFPWQQLKIVWDKHKKDWLSLAHAKQNGFSIVSAPNDTYMTLSCAVPTDLLIEKVKGAMVYQL